METLAQESLRDRQVVRDGVDAKLGRGEGMSPGQAWGALAGVERVEWVLGELWFGVSGGGFHLWIQGHAERDFDAPRYVAAIGRLAEGLDPDVGALLRWTGERGRGVRAKERGEALFSIVPMVWEPVLERAGPVFQGIVERWPAGLELGDLEAGEPPVRGTAVPDPGPCRYPACAIGFTDAATERCSVRAQGPGFAAEAALFGLWKHGVSDAELEAFGAEAADAGAELGGTLARWVDFDGLGVPPDAKSLGAFRRSLDPIAAILGIESSRSSVLHRVNTSDLDRLEEELRPYGAVRVRPNEETNFLLSMRSALRMDAPVLLVDSRDIETQEHVTLVVNGIWSGTTVAMGGDAPGARLVLQEIEEKRPF